MPSTVHIDDAQPFSEQFRVAIEATPTGMVMVDQSGEIVLVNARAEEAFGYSRRELVGRPIELLVPERFRSQHPELRAAFASRPEFRAMGVGCDLYGLRKDGAEIPIEIGLNPVHTPEGDFVLASIVDISRRKCAEKEREALLGQLRELNVALEQRVRDRTEDLTATLREREVLLQEIHHRVKNNLYVIVSLMAMQARLLPKGEARRALEDCEGRVHAIALIHEKLYQSKNYSAVPFADYLRGLAGDVFEAIGVSDTSVSLVLAVEDVSITVEKAIPCGLILNELITNALEHAFPNGRRGTIRVELGRMGSNRLRFAVVDDGVGIPEGLNIQEARSLGLRLVSSLARQLDGELRIERDNGSSFELTFPVEA